MNNSSSLVQALSTMCEFAGMQAATDLLDRSISDEDALRAELERLAPDAVICDIAPPVQENWEKFRRVHAIAARFASLFIVTSSQDLQPFDLPGLDQSIVVLKPYDMELLVQDIRKLLEEMQGKPETSPA